MPIDFDKYNQAIQDWAVRTTANLKSTAKGMGITHRSNSPSSSESVSRIKSRLGYDRSGAVSRVTFGNINRSLIYASFGAGNGIGGSKGSRWIDAHGNRKSTDPDSLGKLGSGNRKAKPFIDSTLDRTDGIEALADIAAGHLGDAIIESVYTK